MKDINRREFLKFLLLSSATLAIPPEFPFASEFQAANNEKKVPNILIIVFDTLSAEHMSLYGYPRQTTPNLERFAKHSNVYHNHYASGNFTTPGTASLLTGVYPWAHRGFHLFGTTSKKYKELNLFNFLKESHFTNTYTHNPLVQQLLLDFENDIMNIYPMKESSVVGDIYSENLFSSDFSVAFWSETILRGTQPPDDFSGSLFLSRIQKELLEKRTENLPKELLARYPLGLPHNFKGMSFNLEYTIDWIAEDVCNLPNGYVSYYHLWPPHDPYTPRTDFIGMFDDKWKPVHKPEHFFSMGKTQDELNNQRQVYDEYIAFIDEEFGRLYDYFKNTGILENTFLIFTSDHGELFERGIRGHGKQTLHQGLIHVPLIISKPGQQTRLDIRQPTSCVDLIPTLLYSNNQHIPVHLEGQILPGFNNSSVSNERNIFAVEAKGNNKNEPLKNYTIALLKDHYKLVRYRGYREYIQDELFNLNNDPEELNNLNQVEKTILADMQQELEAKLEEINQPEYYKP